MKKGSFIKKGMAILNSQNNPKSLDDILKDNRDYDKQLQKNIKPSVERRTQRKEFKLKPSTCEKLAKYIANCKYSMNIITSESEVVESLLGDFLSEK